MRFSSIIAGFAALSVSSATPVPLSFLPFGNLPSQSSTGASIIANLDTLQGSILKLTTTLNGLDYTNGNSLSANNILKLPAVLLNTIGLNSASSSALLDAKALTLALNSTDSTAIVNKLTNDIQPALKTVTDLLNKAKTSGIVASLTPLGQTDYLKLIQTNLGGLGTALSPYIDTTSQSGLTGVTATLSNLLKATVNVYTS
ncbi:hypothetical protein COL5a_002368 [Colletotrichum fioriniae]|uniref:uncharacterized protein n=1 Tax=Colletotrichum fioriniae TaxID=710243 RepID=UPI002300FEB4|nr:uncharacterized protein COL516b_001921 [Colletotrichum fioriniae]KAJ0311216.1 hypothetical protein COL516b_001921 [Colletotrichum fioriniae]KAJ0331701.1 hypothetical protein COL5a_002368 [Colletotrichum fioriniae]KAJ3941151.1 hypothetical protein N0V96_009029 [Colletotrichum fioriniae]